MTALGLGWVRPVSPPTAVGWEGGSRKPGSASLESTLVLHQEFKNIHALSPHNCVPRNLSLRKSEKLINTLFVIVNSKKLKCPSLAD